ncbi:hypothetical protein Tco_1176765 [Tanacetum coccineum]
MVACLEKSDENAEFHQIVDFLSTCSINYALTVSPTIYTSYIEHFWNTATSKIINYVKQIHAIIDGKAVVISESSVGSDLLFNDEDGVTCLTNDEIFENLALMGYEQLSTKLTFQKGNITPLFASMLVQNQAPEGEGSAVHPEPQPTPSTSQPNVSEPQITSLHIETSLTGAPQTKAHQTAVSQIIFHKAHIEQILPSPTTYQRKRKTKKRRRTKKDTKLPQTSVPLKHGADEAVHNEGVTVPWAMPNVDIPQGMDTGGSPRRQDTIGGTLAQTRSKRVLDLEKEKDAQAVEILNQKKRVKKLERKRKSSISHPRRRKYRQAETSSDDDLDEEDASKQGRRSDKLKPIIVSALVSTVGVTITNVEPRTPPATATVFDDEDVTMAMAQTLIKMKEQKAKEKGVAITDVEDSSRIVRPVRSITTLQPLPTIDTKDKGKCILVKEEHMKIKMRDQGDLQVQADVELAQRLHEEDLAELERAQQERQRQEDDTNAALAKEFDEIQARIDADHELAVRLTHKEQEKYTIEEMARLLAEFFDQRKKQLATARAKEIRNKPPTKTQVRNRMITYLKHMGKYTHQQLKNKTYEKIMKKRRGGLVTFSQWMQKHSTMDGTLTSFQYVSRGNDIRYQGNAALKCLNWKSEKLKLRAQWHLEAFSRSCQVTAWKNERSRFDTILLVIQDAYNEEENG